MGTFATCEMSTTDFPYIHTVLSSNHLGFYNDFWMANCASKAVNGTTESVGPGSYS